MLTDLVITRLPIGLNHSNSMLARCERTGRYAVSNEAMLTLKQGLGRLIRRTRVLHRNLWILDGRVFSQEMWMGMDTMIRAIRRMLQEYRNTLKI